jgi:hypothetical protein
MIGCYRVILSNEVHKTKVTLQWGYSIDSVKQEAMISIIELDCR